MTGETDQPKEGKAVAGSVFTAVIVYAVGRMIQAPHTPSDTCFADIDVGHRSFSFSAACKHSYTYDRAREGLYH